MTLLANLPRDGCVNIFIFFIFFFCQKIMEKDYVATLVFPENDAASVYFTLMART